jgi:hypothetical protein
MVYDTLTALSSPQLHGDIDIDCGLIRGNSHRLLLSVVAYLYFHESSLELLG